MTFIKTTLSAIIAASLLSGCLDSTNKTSDSKIAEVVEKTLMDKPEIIIDSLKIFREREMTKKADQVKDALTNKSEEVKNDPHSLVLGNPKGDVTVVAFKDYRCGYCKKSWETIKTLIAKDKNVRFVFKEFPVLGAPSELASRIALASAQQGKEKYQIFNDILMKHRGPWDEKTLIKLAEAQKLDIKKLKEDAVSTFVTTAINTNRALGKDLGITGTPAFIIGEKLIPGAVPLAYMEKEIQNVRDNGKSTEDAPVKSPEKK